MTKIFILFFIYMLLPPLGAIPITVTSNADSGVGSLRNAIAKAHSDDRIVFDPNILVIYLNNELLIDKNISIIGPERDPKLILDGNFHCRIFYVKEQVTVNFFNINITNGNDGNGGGIFNEGNLTLSKCILSNNSSNWNGGGIYNN
jgi:hypothetical protein